MVLLFATRRWNYDSFALQDHEPAKVFIIVWHRVSEVLMLRTIKLYDFYSRYFLLVVLYQRLYDVLIHVIVLVV